jgi:hypothetical protein
MGGQGKTKKTSLAYWCKKKSTEYSKDTSIVVIAHKLHGELASLEKCERGVTHEKRKKRGGGTHIKGRIAAPCHKDMGPKSNFDINKTFPTNKFTM